MGDTIHQYDEVRLAGRERWDVYDIAPLFDAPNNSQSSCVGGVLAENAVSLGLDFLGTLPIPEAGGVTRLVGQQLGVGKIGAIYRGVVADQQGAKFLNGLRNTTSAGALLGNASDTSGLGLASTAVGGAALTAGYFVPVLGQIDPLWGATID